MALLGPLGTSDAVTGEDIFETPTDNEPFAVPIGYGVRHQAPRSPLPSEQGAQHPVYAETLAGNEYFLPLNHKAECIEKFDGQVARTPM